MSDLFSSLSMAARALAAQRMGLDVVGQNIANANTAGYSRRQIDFASVPPADALSAGGGVTVEAIRATRDALLERRLQLERPAQGREAAIADSLSVVEASLGAAGESIDGRLADFFNAFATLAEEPTSSTARQGVLLQGRELANAFSGMSSRFDSARRDADTRVRGLVERVNDIAARVAMLNDSIARSGGDSPATLGLRDELGEAVKELSDLVDVDVLSREDGGLDVTFANGRAMVIGGNAYPVDVGVNAEGMAALLVGGADITSEVTGGQIGGLLQVRDVLVPEYQQRLDAMAYALAQRVNTLHTAGYDLAGQPGGNFFTPLAAAAGAARLLALDPAMGGAPNRVAAASIVAPGDNGNARALAALREAQVVDGTATLTDAWAQLAYRIGQDSATAQAEQANRKEVVTQINALRDAVSGVSLDEEAMLMMKFQRAYEANARFFQTIDAAIETLMNMAGR